MLSLHDTTTGERAEIEPRVSGELSLYVCGPTVYDVPHLGHGRSALVYDVLRRYLEWSGWRVEHVSNITDIDDKIIARAAESGRSPFEVAAEYEDAWWAATDRLGVLRPTHSPRATEYVEEMVGLISRLVESGHAYQAPGGVWFSCESVPGYGLLAHQSLDSLRSGARVEVDEAKRSPVDFALWKLAKPGEPSWPSPWGDGRPGWHTECVVMSLDLLGDGFDLHAGGIDLKFPHHENERAQAVALGNRFAHHWMHHAFVEVGGEKMSKSLGNYLSLTDLVDKEDPRAFRLLTLRAHYRSPMEVTPAAIADATDALGRLDSLARRLDRLATIAASSSGPASRSPSSGPSSSGPASSGPASSGPASRSAQHDSDALDRFRNFMDADLDTPRATALVFDLIRRANASLDSGDAGTGSRLGTAAFEMAKAMGLSPAVDGDEVPPEVGALLDQRAAARAAREWAASDALRSRIAGLGWTVEDGPGGTQNVHPSR